MRRGSTRGWALAGALLWATTAGAVGPFERNHPRAEEGLKALEQGRYEDALRAFEAAKVELPGSQALDYNRAEALVRLGRLQEAKALFGQLAQTAPPQLREKAVYNLGNVHAQLSERKEAIAAYRKALALDPNDADARHNLELVLRNLKPPQPPEPDGGRPDAGQNDAGTDGGSPDAGAPDGGAQDGGSPDGGQGDGGTRDGGQNQPGDGGHPDGGEDGGSGGGDDPRQDGGEGKGEQQPRDAGEGEELPDGGQDAQPQEVRDIQPGDAGVRPGELSPEEAERLLDALKQNERNLQLWRFQRRKEPRDADKDW